MELIKVILSEENLDEALRRVKVNKGAPGIDEMPVSKLDEYFKAHKDEIKTSIMEMKYKPLPVRRVYIPKSNGKKRPLGIPTAVDRVIQQAVAQVLSQIYDSSFSENSYGFRSNRSAHDAIDKVLEYLNEGYEWVIDLDIEKYFDTVNHDKLISILREKVNDKTTLHLIRSFLRAGVMENGLTSPTEILLQQSYEKIILDILSTNKHYEAFFEIRASGDSRHGLLCESWGAREDSPGQDSLDSV